jgi:Dyp-type peroxidase family
MTGAVPTHLRFHQGRLSVDKWAAVSNGITIAEKRRLRDCYKTMFWGLTVVDRNAEEQLELDQIQGDILVGLQKEAQIFVGFSISDPVRFKRFLTGLHLTTAREALQAEDRIAAFRANGGSGLLDIRGINIAFSIDGLKKLDIMNTANIKDVAFKSRLATRSPSLNDPTSGPGAVANWLVGNGVGELDGLLIITGRGKAEVMATLGDLDQAAGDGTWVPFYTGIGNTRPGAEHGHEHFGYLDGVSQPSVRGRIDHLFPGKKFLNPGQSADPNQGLPGSDLHWPGEFVFGYAEQDRTDVEKFVGAKDGGLPWMKNGSYMVFRRLEQLVPEFHETARAKAAQLGMSPDLLEARMVGRFPSGSPIILNPTTDVPEVGKDPLRNNDFDFGDKDIEGRECPYAAHIRKSYPRNDLTPAAGTATGDAAHVASEADTQTHRIMRRGIPFGPEIGPGEQAAKKTHASRGLMFVCYQTSITDQFEFILKNWVNNRSFAVPNAGFDPLLGQAPGANRARTFTGALGKSPSGKPPILTLPEDFIRPTGGGYFFMPSIHAIQSVLAA